MNYALINNNIVENIIWLYPENISEFPNAIYIGDRSVSIGDTYIDGKFYRDGVEILTPLEDAERKIAIYEEALTTIGIVL